MSEQLKLPGLDKLTADYPGRKYDAEKEMLDLLPSEAMLALGKVYTFGAKKYSAHNWRAGIAWSRIWAAILRHGFKFWAGEDIDPESGLSHVDHMAWNAIALAQYFRDRRNFDDRYVTPTSNRNH